MTPLLLVKVIAVALFIVPGILSFVSAALGAKWFLESRSAAAFRRHLGPRGARLFYGILGLLLIGAGIMIFFDPAGRFS